MGLLILEIDKRRLGWGEGEGCDMGSPLFLNLGMPPPVPSGYQNSDSKKVESNCPTQTINANIKILT